VTPTELRSPGTVERSTPESPRVVCPACPPPLDLGLEHYVSHVFCPAHGAAFRQALQDGADRPMDVARAVVVKR
jgi:hypothetical protein